MYTGGGSTELLLDLLFDTGVAGSILRTEDVRELTGRLWALTENASADEPWSRPPVVRFVWGKSWNMPGIVTGVAERLEQFTPGGVPQRSWLRMRLVRVAEAEAEPQEALPRDLGLVPPAEGTQIPEEQVIVHQVLGGGTGSEGEISERLEDIAFQYYGDPGGWRLLAAFNGIDAPTRISPGTILRIPSLSAVGAGR